MKAVSSGMMCTRILLRLMRKSRKITISEGLLRKKSSEISAALRKNLCKFKNRDKKVIIGSPVKSLSDFITVYNDTVINITPTK